MAQLTMAIPQDRYVKITSANGGDSVVAERDLGGLVFSEGKGWAPSEGLRTSLGLTDIWDPNFLVVVHSAEQAAKYFASDSDELAFARKYFAYLAPPPASSAPTTLTYARVKVYDDGAPESMLVWKTVSGVAGWYDSGDTLVENPIVEGAAAVLARVAAGTSNFGSFTFIDGDYLCEDIKAAAVLNAGFNDRYLFALATNADASSAASDSLPLKDATAATLASYVGEASGFCLLKGKNLLSAHMPMVVFAATNYNTANAAPNQMYRVFAGEEPVVFTEDEANLLDSLNVNYYALVQTGGNTRAFYQRGRNSDGEDTAVYCNEVWLKSHISAEIFDLQLTINRIPANSDGAAMISSIVTAAGVLGVTNGAIEPGKTLDDQQRIRIQQLTGSTDAWMIVRTVGYYVVVVVVKDPETKDYKAVYRLVYAKGDSIKFVEGTHTLI